MTGPRGTRPGASAMMPACEAMRKGDETMTTDDARARIPDSRAGRALAGYLAALDSDDPAALTRWVQDSYAPAALRDAPAADRASTHALTRHTTRGFELVAIERAAEDEIVALGRARLTGDWARASVRTTPEGITAARIRPAAPPDGVGPPRPLSDAEAAEELAAYAERLAAADIFSGAVLLARDGVPFFERAWGLASHRYGVPNRVDTTFNLGSMNKMFTAVRVAQLVEQGRLRFDSTVAEVFPAYPGPGAAAITVHQLLTHTSGLGDYFNDRFTAAKARLRTVDDFLPLFQDDPLRFPPGERFSYSNAGMLLLGALIERVTGADYFDDIREHVYAVAGMPDTEAYEMDRPVPNLAIGYTLTNGHGHFVGGDRRNNLFMHVVKGGPAGGGFATLRDLLAFDRALRGHRLLGPEMTATLLAPKVPTDPSGERHYAYGFEAARVNGSRVVGHGGGFAGISAQLDICLDSGHTIVVLSNYDPPIAQQISGKARELLLR